MQEKDFRALGIKAVVDYFNSQVDSTDKNGKITEDNLYIDYHYTTEDENKIFPELETKEKELKALQEQLNEVESKMKELGLEF